MIRSNNTDADQMQPDNNLISEPAIASSPVPSTSTDQNNQTSSAKGSQKNEHKSTESYDWKPPKKSSKRQFSYEHHRTPLSSRMDALWQRPLTTLSGTERKLYDRGFERTFFVWVNQLEHLLSFRLEKFSKTVRCAELEWRIKVRGSNREQMEIYIECMDLQRSDILSAQITDSVFILTNEQNNPSKAFGFVLAQNKTIHELRKFSVKAMCSLVHNDRIELKICLRVLEVIYHH